MKQGLYEKGQGGDINSKVNGNHKITVQKPKRKISPPSGFELYK